MMLGKIVKVDFFTGYVLGVVLTEQTHEYDDTYCFIARSTLDVTDENIETLKNTSFKELLNLSVSTRVGSDLEIVDDHGEGENIRTKTAEYQEKYRSLNVTELVAITQDKTIEMDDLHRFIFLEVANQKGAYSIVSGLLAAY